MAVSEDSLALADSPTDNGLFRLISKEEKSTLLSFAFLFACWFVSRSAEDRTQGLTHTPHSQQMFCC